jgi:hypothetical protein
MIDLDKLSDEQLKKLEDEYKRICAKSDQDENDDGSRAGKKAAREKLEERGTKGKK